MGARIRVCLMQKLGKKRWSFGRNWCIFRKFLLLLDKEQMAFVHSRQREQAATRRVDRRHAEANRKPFKINVEK